MIRNRGLAFKLILFCSLSCVTIFLIVFLLSYDFSREMIENDVRQNAYNITRTTVNKVESILRSVQKVPGSTALVLENAALDEEEMLRVLQSTVTQNDEIYGAAIAFESYGFKPDARYYAPYYFKDGDSIKFKWLGSDTYRYFYWDWYQIPKVLNRIDWSEPYFDEGGGNVIMATCSVPFYDLSLGQRKFKGVVTADVSLEWLTDIVSSIKVLESGYGFLISKNGTIITHPQRELIMNQTIFSLAEERNSSQLREIGRNMIKGKSGFAIYQSVITGKDSLMYYDIIPSTEWTIAVIFPKEEYMADIIKLNRSVGILVLIGFFLITTAIILISRSITRPLTAMACAAARIGEGDLDVVLPPVRCADEVGKLTLSLESMKKSLKEYIHRLTETTAAKERIESELKVATQIQASMLPRIFPPFPDRGEFNLFALMEPAKEVGGDLYDFFFVDENRLCFLVGDVSGKGVPAALFMAITKTLMNTEARRGGTPDQILAQVNDILYPDNEQCMFVTLLCMILNTETGEVQLSNGGHNPPLLCRGNGSVDFLEVPSGLVVGAMENKKFELRTLTLSPGDVIFLYTDGVTEAMNPKDELFAEARLKQCVYDFKGKDIKSMLTQIRERIRVFTESVSQSDDITMLALKYNGSIK